MKKSALFIILIGFYCSVSGQFRTKDRMDKLESFDQKNYSWGFFLNMNQFDYSLVLDPVNGVNQDYSNAVETKPTYSFGAGLIGKKRLNDHFDLRLEPGLQFVQRELNFQKAAYLAGTSGNPEDFTKRIVKSTYVDIPLLLQFHGWRWYNSRPYVAGGINYMLNLQSNEMSGDDNQQGVFRSTTHNFGWSAEMGISFYFGRFKLTPAFRGTFMLNNELVADNPDTQPYWAGSLNSLKTRAFFFILKFE